MEITHDTDKKLKIGVLIRDIDNLRNYEYRILQSIIDHPNLELSLFIKDGRGKALSLKNRLKINLLTPKIFSNILFALQLRLESYIFKDKYTANVDDIISKIQHIETIHLNPVRKGYLDIFSKEDAAKVAAYNLDIILRHEFNIIRGDILNAAHCGIWSYHHADNAINRGGPSGFWEIVNDEPCCGVTLQKLTPELDGGLVIDKAWFNRQWTYKKNSNHILESSVSLLFKNIDILLKNGKIDATKSPVYYNRLYRKPTLKYILMYMTRFYRNILSRIANRLFKKLFKARPSCWALFFGEGNFLEATLFRTNPISMPQNVFWADPFLYKHDDQLYVFFENYSYKADRGKISSGKIIKDGQNKYAVVDVCDVLDLDYHLSYPQVFEEDGEIFMIPETGERNRVEIYRCLQFPNRWELYATAFDGENIVDTTYFRDENGDRWLFLNKGWTHDAELHIYKIENLKLENITAHNLNPVLIDCRKGRNAGALFKYEDEYYRPSQVNTNGVYGKGLQISKLKKLTLEEFEDEDIITIEPNFKKGLVGIHHLHQLNGYFVFDACYKKL